MIRIVGVFLCLGFSVLSNPVLAALCSMGPIRLLDNQTTYGTLYVTSGKRCHINLRSSQGPVHTTQLVAKAGSGSVSISGNRITYLSRQGYAGDDHFIYARQG